MNETRKHHGQPELSATEFLKLVLENADLRLMSHLPITNLTDEQQERRWVLFSILIALFERAYILVYEEQMNRQNRRLWLSWEDYMREWVRRDEFRDALPEHLEGEDPEFTAYIRRLAEAESRGPSGVARPQNPHSNPPPPENP